MKFLFQSSFAHLVLQRSTERVSGGAELQVALLARELALLGEEVVIAAGDTGQADGTCDDGVRIRNAGRFQTGGLADTMRAIPRVLAILREERPDYVFQLGWTSWLFLLWLFRPVFGYRLGFICGLDSEVNGVFRKENPVRGGLFEFAMRRCDVRFAMTTDQKRMFETAGMTCGFYRNLILPRDQPLDAVAKDVDVLWIARCQPVKRPMRFVELARRLTDARCVMVCPNETPALWNEVRDAAAAVPNLEFIERVPYHEVQALYDRARVFVNTSEWEGWPNSFIQAGLAAAAIVSLEVNPDALFETFTPGVACGGSFERMVAAVGDLLADAEALARAGEGSARFVRELHDNRRETAAFLAGLTR